jgi:membrane-bound lytic murein transglycosylase F
MLPPRLPTFFLLMITIITLTSCSIPPPLVERIQAEGKLKVVTRNAATTFYEGPQGFAGFEYELVEMFGDELGVEVEYFIPDKFDKTFDMLINKQVHMAAAGLTVTPGRVNRVRFGPSYQQVTQQVVYRGESYRPRNLQQLFEKNIEVIEGSSHDEELKQLQQQHPDLSWVSRADISSEELMQRVQNQEINYTVADSNEIAVYRRYYPMLRVAFDLTEPQPLAWAFTHAEDSSLFQAMEGFFERIKKDGTLDQLLERYYGHIKQLNYVDTRTFLRQMKSRLPKYQPFFEQAEAESGIEWQMLAAVGYQESHWNPRAKSPTGVRGIMMLTQITAKQVHVTKRMDPEQSIMGGARYLLFVDKRIPKRILNPDRFWLMLASYNIGYAHLEDARILTQQAGGNPDKWADIKKHLPKLSKKRWHQQTKHGYARGNEAVKYVDNIRSYYQLLKWTEAQLEEPPIVEEPELPAVELPAAIPAAL